MWRLQTRYGLRVWLAAGILAAAGSGGPLPALAGDPVSIVNLGPGQMLRLRAEDNSKSEALGYIPFDSQEVTLAGVCTDEWCKVSFRGMTGWSFKKYLDVGPSKPGEPAAAPASGVHYRVTGLASGQHLIIRDNPEDDGDPLGIIPSDGKGIKDRGCAGSWCRVRYQNSVGWVEKRHLAEDDSPADTVGTVVAAAAKKSPEKEAGAEDEAEAEDVTAKRYAVEGILAGQPLTIRDVASIRAAVVGLIPPDAKDIEGLKRCMTKWCLIRYQGVKGWTLRRYLADMDIGRGKHFKVVDLNISDSLMVKDYPSDKADNVGAIPAFGTGIAQIGKCDRKWCHVRFLGTVGWVNARYIALEKEK